MSDSSPTATPMMQSSKPTPEDSKALNADVPYRSAIGSLMYLMICSRPDLGFAVLRVSLKCCHARVSLHQRVLNTWVLHTTQSQKHRTSFDAPHRTTETASVVSNLDLGANSSALIVRRGDVILM